MKKTEFKISGAMEQQEPTTTISLNDYDFLIRPGYGFAEVAGLREKNKRLEEEAIQSRERPRALASEARKKKIERATKGIDAAFDAAIAADNEKWKTEPTLAELKHRIEAKLREAGHRLSHRQIGARLKKKGILPPSRRD